MKLSRLQNYFKEIDFHPSVKLGQNFIIEQSIAQKMVDIANLREGSPVVEIGPGVGMITLEILKRRALLSVVEKDGRLFDYLNTNIDDERLSIIHGDALDIPLAEIAETETSIVISNPPYSIIGPWLAAILKIGLPEQIVLLVQKEVAERLSAVPRTKAYGALSIRLQAAYEITIKHRVPPQCFYPVPEVESAIIQLQRRSDSHRFDPQFSELMQRLFTQRRKQMGSQLKKLITAEQLLGWEAILSQVNLGFSARPEEIPVLTWVKLDQLTRPI